MNIEMDPSLWDSSDDDVDDDEDYINVILYKNDDAAAVATVESPPSKDENNMISKVFDEEKNNYREYLKTLDRSVDEIKQEHKKLVSISLMTSSTRSIIIKSENVYITIPDTIAISPTFRDHIWPPSDAETAQQPLVNIDIFNTLLQTKPVKSGTYGFFAAHYSKVAFNGGSYATKNRYVSDEHFQKNLSNFRNKNKFRQQYHNDHQRPQYHNTVSHQMCFDDFSLIIIKDGVVVDAAIHGYRGYIPELINKYKPSKIYYVAREGDAFDVFMHYKYTPFYTAFRGLTHRLQNINVNTQLNTLVLCDRKQSYCSYCRALQIVYSFVCNIIDEDERCGGNSKRNTNIDHNRPEISKSVIHTTSTMKRIILQPVKRLKTGRFTAKLREPNSAYSILRNSTYNSSNSSCRSTMKRTYHSSTSSRSSSSRMSRTEYYDTTSKRSYGEDAPPRKITRRSRSRSLSNKRRKYQKQQQQQQTHEGSSSSVRSRRHYKNDINNDTTPPSPLISASSTTSANHK